MSLQILLSKENLLLLKRGNGSTVLFSYGIPVAIKTPDGKAYHTNKDFGATTTRHISSWGFEGAELVDQSEIEKLTDSYE